MNALIEINNTETAGRPRHVSADKLAAVMLLAWLVCPRAQGEAEITFHGSLIEAPPCVINGGRQVVVDFGEEVMTTRIDGRSYKQRIPIELDCSGSLPSIQKLRITGTSAAFDPQAFTSGSAQAEFGIALYKGSGSSRYTPGEWLSFTEPAELELWAAPVKQDGTTLTGGAFSILTSMVVAYQ